MKKLLSAAVCLMLSWLAGSAQSRTVRYCVVEVVQQSIAGGKALVHLQDAKHAELFSFRDSTTLPRLRRVSEMETVTDALNYLAGIGWSLTATATYSNGYTLYCFKREFAPEDLLDTPMSTPPASQPRNITYPPPKPQP